MRYCDSLCSLVLIVAVFSACQKSKVFPAPASFTVVHAMFNGNPIQPKIGSDTAGRYYKNANSANTLVKISYGASQLYSPVAGATPLLIVPSTDTVFNIFNGSFSFESGAVYSFFLSGDTAHADTLLVRDNIPYYSDSSTGVRFVNLYSGGKTLKVNIYGDAGHVQFGPLSYRQLSSFRRYSATLAAGSSYKFEIRDQSTGDSLAAYTWSYPRFRNSTIVIAGSTTLKVFSVNNY